MSKKDEIKDLLATMSKSIVDLSRLIEQDVVEPTPNNDGLINHLWYKYEMGDDDNYLIYKTDETKGFGWNKIGLWVGVSHWDFSFKSEPESWQVALDGDVKRCLKLHTQELYKEAIMIDQSGVVEGNAIVTAIQPHDDVSVSYEKIENGGEEWKVMLGLKLVFSTKSGKWAKPLTQKDITLNSSTWYVNKSNDKQLIFKTRDGIFLGFDENGKYRTDLKRSFDNSQGEWVKATKKEISKMFEDYAKKTYPRGRNWIQINKECNLYTFNHDLMDVEVYSSGNVVVWMDELKLFDLMAIHSWAPRLDIAKPIIGGHELKYLSNADGKFIVFGEDRLPIEWFKSTKDVSVSELKLSNGLYLDSKQMDHINLYLQTQELI